MVDRECIPDTVAASLIEHFEQPTMPGIQIKQSNNEPQKMS